MYSFRLLKYYFRPRIPPLLNKKKLSRDTKNNIQIETFVSFPYFLRDDFKRVGGDNTPISGKSSEKIRNILQKFGYMEVSYINTLFSDSPFSKGIFQYFCEYDDDIQSVEFNWPYHGKILKNDFDLHVKRYMYELLIFKPKLVLAAGDVFYWLFKKEDPRDKDWKGIYEIVLHEYNFNFMLLAVDDAYKNTEIFEKDLKKYMNALPIVFNREDYKDVLNKKYLIKK
jgi:hypothetical protein